jgi:hypothetical protein
MLRLEEGSAFILDCPQPLLARLWLWKAWRGNATTSASASLGSERCAGGLADWAIEGEILFRSVHPDFAEAAVFQAVAAIRV